MISPVQHLLLALQPLQMSTLVLAEAKQSSGSGGSLTLTGAARSALLAAAALGKPVTALVAGGEGVEGAAKEAAAVPGVSKVLLAKHPALYHPLAEPWSVLAKALCDK